MLYFIDLFMRLVNMVNVVLVKMLFFGELIWGILVKDDI